VPTGVSLALLADAGHVLGAGGWLGGLLLLLGIGLPASLTLEEGVRGEAVTELVRSFSAVALGCAGLVVVTGGIGAWLHLGGLAALWGSGYGRALLLKLGVVGVVVATGGYNYLRVRPVAGSVAGARRLRRSSTVELAIAIVVLAVTAVLVALPTPRGESDGASVEAPRAATGEMDRAVADRLREAGGER
jgi:putative copper export protein